MKNPVWVNPIRHNKSGGVFRKVIPAGSGLSGGRLVHAALCFWHFPDYSFDAFMPSFALEAGRTDPAGIHAAIQEAGRLLEQFRVHPI